jgi:hypothetical protein
MDDVLREALKVPDASMFGPRQLVMEYRNGEFYEEGGSDGGEGPLPSGAPPAQPGLSG